MLALIFAAAITHGIAIGDVRSDRAIVWSRASEAGAMVVELDTSAGLDRPRTFSARASADTDFTAQVTLDALTPDTRYVYRVSFNGSDSAEGTFRTPPAAGDTVPVRFVVMGDLGGHGYCREAGVNYAVFSEIETLEPHFLVANGDMIYADSACDAERSEGGRNVPGDFPAITDPEVDWLDAAAVREVFLAHWRYNRADPHFQRLLSKTPMYSQWDDHEVINDFGAPWTTLNAWGERGGYPVLVQEGRRALFDFHPIERHPEEPYRIYRSFRWGQDAELFLLDARSYRSENELADDPDKGKTLLGAAQLSWLKKGLEDSTATWKIVSTDVPLSIPTGSNAHLVGRDAFANGAAQDYSARTGFERELEDLLRHLDAADIDNVVFVATDVHFATSLRYDVDVDGDGDTLLFHELISGPLSAAKLSVQTPDPTFAPTILFAEGNLFNFSFVSIERIDGISHLIADIRDDSGTVRFGSRVDLIAR